jgi:hypothetical protein
MSNQFQISSSRQVMAAFIRAHFEGKADPGTLPYEAVSQHMGQTVHGSLWGTFRKAVEDAAEALGENLDLERGVGVRRMRRDEVTSIAEAGMRRVRRGARRYARRQIAAISREDGLSEYETNRAIANAVTLRTISELTKRGNLKRVEQAVNTQGGDIPVGRLAEILKS